MSADKEQGTDALILLIEDHRRVAKLFERAETDPTAFEEIQAELTRHARVEEELFYPAVRSALPETERERVDVAVEDHADVKQMLSELSALAAGSEEFQERLQELRDSVLQHVEEEEDELFARTRELLDGAALADLGARIESRKEELKAATVEA